MAAILLAPSAERDLKRLPSPAQEAIRREHAPRLAENPRADKPLHGPLRGYFSYDFWARGISYRIAYEMIRGDVIILMIDSRDNFYEKFSRRLR